MTRFEGWQNPEQKTSALGDFGFLLSGQDFCQQIVTSNLANENLPLALDFGTATELYQPVAYNGERLSARVFMADEVEQKLDAPKIQQPSDAAKQDGVITGQPNQEVHGKAFATTHKDDKYPSGIMPALHESFGIEGDLTAADTGIKPATAQEAPAPLQKPPTEKVLLATNVTPNIPNLAQMQRYQDVQSDSSRPQVERLALRDDYLNRSEMQKLVPKDGDNLTLKQVLEDYKTPFMDAYESSKHLKDGDSGKSKTLEDVVDRLKDCPWADQIRIKFDSRADNTEYRNTDSTIVIRPQDPIERQIENFAHEGYHATHQFMSQLYDHGKQTETDFVDIWLQGEVNAMLTETSVFHELGLKGTPPAFGYIDSDGNRDSISIEQYVKANSERGLREFLRVNQPEGRNAIPYGQHYAGFYNSYISNFERNKPDVDQYIKQWVQSGRSRSTI